MEEFEKTPTGLLTCYSNLSIISEYITITLMWLFALEIVESIQNNNYLTPTVGIIEKGINLLFPYEVVELFCNITYSSYTILMFVIVTMTVVYYVNTEYSLII